MDKLQTTGARQRKLKERFTRSMSAGDYDRNAIVQQRGYKQLVRLIAEHGRHHYHHTLEVGCGSGGFTQALCHAIEIDRLTLNDLCPATVITAPLPPHDYIQGNAENALFTARYDLIAAAAAMQWFVRPDRFLEQMAQHLAPRGTLLLSTFGPENFREIRHLTGRGLAYPTIDELRQWLEPHYQIHALEEEHVTLRFATPHEVLKHMHDTGVGAASNRPWMMAEYRHFCRLYPTHYAHPDGLPLTYHPIYLLATRR